MILHLFPADKFLLPFYHRMNGVFTQKDHFYVIHGKRDKKDEDEYGISELVKNDNVLRVDRLVDSKDQVCDLFNRSNRIILHSLTFKGEDLIFLSKQIKKDEKHITWVIWGADLYNEVWYNRSLQGICKIKPIIRELYRKRIIKRINLFLTMTDYDMLKKSYQLSPNHKRSYTIYSYDLPNIINENSNVIPNVLVGHSATPTCRHIETFELLRQYKDVIEVYCPLSYPDDKEYINKVVEKGTEIFRDRFHPIIKYMNYDEYMSFLSTIDIGIFNNNRQQGFGNITSLLYFGKKVYLSSDNTVKNVYSKKDFIIFDINEINENDFLNPLTVEQVQQNKERINYMASDKYFYNRWNYVFTVDC